MTNNLVDSDWLCSIASAPGTSGQSMTACSTAATYLPAHACSSASDSGLPRYSRCMRSIFSTRDTALTVHLVMPDGSPGDDCLRNLADELDHRFGICHATMQVEQGSDCGSCPLEEAGRV